MSVPTPADAFADRALIDFARKTRMPEHATRAVLEAHRLLGLTFGAQIAERRNSPEPLQQTVADLAFAKTLLHTYQEIVLILLEHLDKTLAHHRSQYTPELRFRILAVKKLLLWSQEETARQFRVSPGTITRWEAEATRSPEANTIAKLVRPKPPVRRFADVVRRLVQAMAASGFGGNFHIAQTLARAGWKTSKDTVRRIRHESLLPPPEPRLNAERSLKAKYPGHVFMADLTEIPVLFRLFSLKLAVVFDAFSRMPLVGKLFLGNPSARTTSSLMKQTAAKHTTPQHFISDQGPQFRAEIFRKTLQRLGVAHRFGAIGKSGAIALIERFWKTLKQLLHLTPLAFVFPGVLDKRVAVVLHYYAHLRPHQGLRGATPAEIYYGKRPAYLSAIPPPRGRPEGPPEPPYRIAFLDPERRLPYLVRQAA